jgi:hypothetical protein
MRRDEILYGQLRVQGDSLGMEAAYGCCGGGAHIVLRLAGCDTDLLCITYIWI